jgi:hypothetical protein
VKVQIVNMRFGVVVILGVLAVVRKVSSTVNVIGEMTHVTANGCDGTWKVATMTGYDNLDGGDDKHPGSLAEWTGTTDKFLNTVPVASILESLWDKLKYRNILVNYNGKQVVVQSWDECANADCGSDDPDCCTRNAVAFGGDFLLDIDRHALKNLYGIDNYGDTFAKVQYQICDSFNPAPIAQEYGLTE